MPIPRRVGSMIGRACSMNSGGDCSAFIAQKREI